MDEFLSKSVVMIGDMGNIEGFPTCIRDGNISLVMINMSGGFSLMGWTVFSDFSVLFLKTGLSGGFLWKTSLTRGEICRFLEM